MSDSAEQHNPVPPVEPGCDGLIALNDEAFARLGELLGELEDAPETDPLLGVYDSVEPDTRPEQKNENRENVRTFIRRLTDSRLWPIFSDGSSRSNGLLPRSGVVSIAGGVVNVRFERRGDSGGQVIDFFGIPANRVLAVTLSRHVPLTKWAPAEVACRRASSGGPASWEFVPMRAAKSDPGAREVNVRIDSTGRGLTLIVEADVESWTGEDTLVAEVLAVGERHSSRWSEAVRLRDGAGSSVRQDRVVFDRVPEQAERLLVTARGPEVADMRPDGPINEPLRLDQTDPLRSFLVEPVDEDRARLKISQCEWERLERERTPEHHWFVQLAPVAQL